MCFCKTENAAIDSLFRNNHDTILCVFWNAFGTRSWEHSGTRSECVLERVPERIRNAFWNAERVRNAFFVRLFPDSTVPIELSSQRGLEESFIHIKCRKYFHDDLNGIQAGM